MLDTVKEKIHELGNVNRNVWAESQESKRENAKKKNSVHHQMEIHNTNVMG